MGRKAEYTVKVCNMLNTITFNLEALVWWNGLRLSGSYSTDHRNYTDILRMCKNNSSSKLTRR